MKISHTLAIGFVATMMLAGCATVHPGEGGLRFRPYRSRQSEQVLGEGTYPKAPWNRIIIYDLRYQHSSAKVDVQTVDKLHMIANVSVTYRVLPNALWQLHRTLGPDFYATTVAPLLLTEVRAAVSGQTYDAVVPGAQITQEKVRDALSKQLAPMGIDVARVVLADVDFPESIKAAVTRQTTLTQEVKNQELELMVAKKAGEIAAQKAKSETQARLAGREGEAAIATKDAEIAGIRAKGDADAAKIRAASVSPIYLKLRSIEALEKIASSANAKVYMMPLGKDGLPISIHSDQSDDGR